MLKQRMGWVSVGLASLFVTGAWSARVDACSPPVQGWYAQPVAQVIPADGALIVSLTCYSQCSSESTSITVRNQAGEDVAGELEKVELDDRQRLLVFRPAAGFALGEYEFDVSGTRSSGEATSDVPFEVVAASPTSFGDLEVAFSARVDQNPHESVCCPDGPRTSCGDSLCLATQIRKHLFVEVDLSNAIPELLRSQYVHRAHWEGAETEVTPFSLRTSEFASFSAEQNEYCYTLEFKHLATGAIERSERFCEPFALTEELGVFPRDRAELDLSLATCDAPPAGYESSWCPARRSRCKEFGVSACASLEQHCADFPPVGAAGAPGSAGAPGTKPTDGDSSSHDDHGGCSVNHSGSQPRSGVVATLVALAVALGLRRAQRG